jgi:pre-mRNA-splicing factor SYF1
VQARLFKSIKLWSFYVDLEESLGTVESTKAVYDKILELRIANAQIIINYAAFLEDNNYFEESFKVYERGVELFTFPVSFEIWNIYLSKFVKRYVSFRRPSSYIRVNEPSFCTGWIEIRKGTRFVRTGP